jgi:hypothetical protein
MASMGKRQWFARKRDDGKLDRTNGVRSSVNNIPVKARGNWALSLTFFFKNNLLGCFLVFHY